MSFRTHRAVLVAAASAAALTVLAPARAETWTSGSGTADWITPGSWTEGTVPNAVGASAVFNVGTAARTVNVGGPITVGSISLDGSGTTTNQIGSTTGTNAITFDTAGAGPATFSINGGYSGSVASTSNVNTVRIPVVLQDNLTISVAPRAGDYSGIVLSFLGAGVQFITGPGGVTKTGLGTMVFADTAKAFEGPLVVNQGRLRFNATGGVSATSSVTVNPGGQLFFEQGTAGPTNTNITLGTASTVVTLSGRGTVEPPTQSNGGYQPGAIRTGNGFTQTLTNPVVLAAGDAAINVNNAYNFSTNTLTNPGTLTLANQVSGANGRLILGELGGSPLSGGTLVLAAANTYGGGTRIQLGTLVAGANGALGTGDVFVDGDTSQANAASGQFPTLANGKLTITAGTTNVIADSATLTITGDTAVFNGSPDGAPGGYVTLESGVNETVRGLVLGGIARPNGVYGSSTSGAPLANQFDAYFQGSGTITVVPEPAALSLIGFVGLGLLGRRRKRS